jgi:hypothetical protein
MPLLIFYFILPITLSSQIIAFGFMQVVQMGAITSRGKKEKSIPLTLDEVRERRLRFGALDYKFIFIGAQGVGKSVLMPFFKLCLLRISFGSRL